MLQVDEPVGPARGGVASGSKRAIFVTGVGMSPSAHPRFLDYEQDPDPYLPAGPGLFHIQGDDKRKKSHIIVSSLKARLSPQSGRPILPECAAGPALLLPPSKTARASRGVAGFRPPAAS